MTGAYSKFNSVLAEAVWNNYFPDSEEIQRKAREIYAKRRIHEELQEKNPDVPGVMKEAFKENLTWSNNTALYESTVSAIVARALRAPLLARNVIKMVQRDFKGVGSHLTPISQRLTGSDANDDGTVSFPSGKDYSSATEVDVTPQVVGQGIAMNLIRHSQVGLLKEQIEEIGYALGERQDVKFLAGLDTLTPTDDSESNYDALGASTDLSWDAIETYTEEMQDNKAFSDVILTNPGSAKSLRGGMEPTEKTSVFIGGELHEIPIYYGQRIVTHPSVSAKTTYLIDTRQVGFFFYDNPQTMQGRAGGHLKLEVIGWQPVSAQMAVPLAAHRIKDNTA